MQKKILLISKCLLYALIMICIAAGESYGQEGRRTIIGSVADDSGGPLPGASIIIKGSNLGTTTDANGNFSLESTSEQDILVFSFVGHISQEISVRNQTKFDIKLQSEVTTLSEIVVTGYQVQKKSELTGAVAVVSMEDIAAIPTHNPLQTLQGRVAGLHITRDGTPGGGTRSTIIRGMNTLGNNAPLYIIDGQPVGSEIMDMLDPNDIESLQVLKDASAASIYGSRASNGVIIITTKRAKANTFKVDINSGTSIQDYYAHWDMLNTEERGRLLWQASMNDGTDPNTDHPHYDYDWSFDADGNPVLNDIQVVDYLSTTAQGGIRSGNTDWFKQIAQPGYMLRNNVAISSGGEAHNLLFSFGHLYNQGIVKYTDYERFTFRLNSSFDLIKGKLKVGENLQVTTSSQTPMGSGQGGTPIDLGIVGLPILPVYAEDGSFAGPIGSGFSNRMNALQVAELSKEWNNGVKAALGNIYLEITPVKNLMFRSSFGIDYRIREDVRINPRFTAGFLSLKINNYSNQIQQENNWTWFNTLNYNIDKGKHQGSILVGTEAIKNDFSSMRGYKEDFLLETPDYFQIDAGTGLFSLSGNGTGHKLLSYFSKVNYNFNSKYLATITLRADGSSRFGEENRFGFFPAFSVGWRISGETFVKESLPFISQLMLRYGMGRTGNQRIADDATYGLFIPAYGQTVGRRNIGSAYDLSGVDSGSLPSGVVARQTGNPGLKWESTNEINLGVDFGIFEQRLSGSFDYFVRKTEDILIRPPYLAVVGEGGARWENGATMDNRGWEVALRYDDQIKDFNYQITATVGSFRDEIMYLPASVVRSYAGNVEKTIIGRFISSIFGYVSDGIFQNQSEVDAHAVQPGKGVGRLRYRDLNGDGVIDVLDQDWLGASIPDFEYGLNTNLGYKNFSLTFFLQGVQGINYHNTVKNQSDLLGAFAGQNNTTRILNAWTPQNPNTDIPAASNFDSNNESRISNYQIENASYVKLRNVQLGFTLPERIQQALRLNSGQIYISGSELFTLKSKQFTSPDPENPSTFYPIARTYTLGFNLSF